MPLRHSFLHVESAGEQVQKLEESIGSVIRNGPIECGCIRVEVVGRSSYLQSSTMEGQDMVGSSK